MEAIIRPIKELMILSFFALLFGGVFLSFFSVLMAVSY